MINLLLIKGRDRPAAPRPVCADPPTPSVGIDCTSYTIGKMSRRGSVCGSAVVPLADSVVVVVVNVASVLVTTIVVETFILVERASLSPNWKYIKIKIDYKWIVDLPWFVEVTSSIDGLIASLSVDV